MSFSFGGDRVSRVSDDADNVSVQEEQTRLRQSEYTSPDPRQGHRLQTFEGATGQSTGDEGLSRGMLAQPNASCPATESASSFVGDVQDPVSLDNNDTHAILEPTQDSYQHDINSDDNKGNNNGPIFFTYHGQQLPHISDSDPNDPCLQHRSNSSNTLVNCNNTIFFRSHLGPPTFPSPSFPSSSVQPLSPSAISLQTPSVATVGSYSIASFPPTSALPLAGAMPAYPSPIGLSDPTPSQPNTSSSLPLHSRFFHHQHHSIQQQQLEQRHPHPQHHQNHSNETHLQRPTHPSRKTTSSTQQLHQSSPSFPSTLSNSSPIIPYSSHNQSSTLHYHHPVESATKHGSTSFTSWTNSRSSHHGGSGDDGRVGLSNAQVSAQQHHHQWQEGSRISPMDNNYSMSIHPLEQVTSSSNFSSPAPSPSRRSFSHLQQGRSSSSSHLTLPTPGLFECTSPYFHRSLPAAPHSLDNAQEKLSEGGAGASLMTEGDQDLWETPRERERRSRMAEGVDRSDTWQPFHSLSYSPDAPNHMYTSSPGETTLHMGTPAEGSNGLQNLAAISGVEEEGREESDIERYSGLIMKSIAQSTTRKIGSRSETSSLQRHPRHDLELGRRLSRSGTDLPPPSLMEHTRTPSSRLSSSDEHDDYGRATEDARVGGIDAAIGSNVTSPNPRLAAFSFSSLRLNGLMSRLFGSQRISGSSNDVRNQGVGLSSSGGDRVEVSSSTGFGPRSTTTEPTQQHNEKVDGTKAQQRTPKVHMSHPGGILSNLLKLQALSIPPPSSSRHRKRRRTRRKSSQQATVATAAAAAAWKKNFRKSSLGAELLPPSSSSSQILRTSRNASVISLPGLIMAAPSGVGFAPPTMSAASEDGGGGGASPPVVATASSAASAISAEGSLYLRSSPSVFAAATAAMRLQPPPNIERPLVGTAAAGGERRDSTQFLQTTRQVHSTRSSISADDSTSMYSGVSRNPQLEAMRLHQQAELAEVLADIMLRQDLLIRLYKSLIRYGAPSHRIELAMEAMCKTFGIDGSFAFLPGLMMISFGDSDTHTSETHLIKCAQGFDMGRLAKVNKIARAVVYGDLEPSEALMELKAINNEKPPYGIWVMLASFAVSSGLIAPLVFKGSWYDMLAGMGLGSVVGLTSLLASRYSVYSNVFEVSTSIVIAFVAKALREYVCFTGVVLSGIVTLLPGLSLTTAIMELSSRYMISGSVRMFYSLIYCLFLGFGLSIGSNLWDVFKEPPPGDLKMGYCHPATEPWRWVLFPLLAIGFNIQLYAIPKQWPVMIVCSSVGYAVSEFAGLYWPHSLHIAAALSAFVVGLLGNIYERLTHELAFVPILGAILLIVPGGMGVRSSLLLLDQSGNAAQGTAFALQMIVVALGIAVGLFASTLIVYPLGKKRNALLTF